MSRENCTLRQHGRLAFMPWTPAMPTIKQHIDASRTKVTASASRLAHTPGFACAFRTGRWTTRLVTSPAGVLTQRSKVAGTCLSDIALLQCPRHRRHIQAPRFPAHSCLSEVSAEAKACLASALTEGCTGPFKPMSTYWILLTHGMEEAMT